MFDAKIKKLNRNTIYSTNAGKYTIQDIQRILSISRPTVYKMIDQGCFQTVKVGNRTMITKASFDIWLDDKED
ncbi:MAG: DNA-binding protein [Clostridia bacterium]|nr:DNA-binding protein [Clostridia bacterium]